LIAEYPGQFACVVMEPATTEEPKFGFLHQVQEFCSANGIVFILDEMITGFRWHLKGAQFMYGISPDLCTFGKAMANGFAVACVAGKREIMELGSIEFAGRERVFLLSTTHGAEMCGLGAFVATVKFIQDHNAVQYLWDYGIKLKALMQRKANEYDISQYFIVGGVACSPYFLTLDSSGNNSLLFSEKLALLNKILVLSGS
jgi:glutamate-1-semialdehyde 2,1-aminomutase